MKKYGLTNDNCRYVYLPGIPPKVKGFVMEDEGYYTVVLNPALSADTNRKTKLHEIKHILRRDFDKADCDQVESGVRGLRMTTGDRIKQRRLELGLSVDEVATKLGKNRATVYRYESNDIENLPVGTLEPLAEILDTTPAYLMGWNSDDYPISDGCGHSTNVGIVPAQIGTYRIPVLSTVAAGRPMFSDDDVIEYIDYDKEPRNNIIGVRIEGDSMMPAIQDGDTVVIDREAVWEDGDVVIVTVSNNYGMCKRIKRYADGIALISNNPSYEPKYYSAAEVNALPVRVIGKVKELRRKF